MHDLGLPLMNSLAGPSRDGDARSARRGGATRRLCCVVDVDHGDRLLPVPIPVSAPLALSSWAAAAIFATVMALSSVW
jgi:hypothetical protein